MAMTEFRKVTMLPIYRDTFQVLNYIKAVSLYFTLKQFFRLPMAPGTCCIDVEDDISQKIAQGYNI